MEPKFLFPAVSSRSGETGICGGGCVSSGKAGGFVGGPALPALIFLFLVPCLLAAQTPAGTTAAASVVPVDQRLTYGVGITAFRGVSLSPEHEYLATSVPSLLFERLQKIPSRRLQPEEIDAYRRGKLEAALLTAGRELTGLQLQRDRLIFDRKTTDQIARERESFKARIEEKKAVIRILEETEPESIGVAGEKPLVFVRGTDQPLHGALPDDSERAVRSLAESRDLDMVIHGVVEEVQGYLFFRVEVYSALLDGAVYRFEDAVAADDVYIVLETLVEEIAGAVLGREWGTLEVAVTPAEARVYVDGVIAGIGSTSVPYLAPASHEVTIRADGFLEHSVRVSVAAGETVSIEASLTAFSKNMMTVLSDPPGADLYLGSLWQGRTPVTVETPQGMMRILLRMQGYKDLQYVFAPSAGEELRFTLSPSIVESPLIETKKKDFYTAFGWFVLSLPLPVASYAISGNYADAALLETSEQARLQLTSNIFNYVYRGGLALSAALLVNAFFQLRDYIRTGEATY